MHPCPELDIELQRGKMSFNEIIFDYTLPTLLTIALALAVVLLGVITYRVSTGGL